MVKLLNWVVEFFGSISTFLGALFKFIYSVFDGIIHFLLDIPTYIRFLSSAIAVLPGFLLPFATVGLFLPVILMLLNRKFGGD